MPSTFKTADIMSSSACTVAVLLLLLLVDVVPIKTAAAAAPKHTFHIAAGQPIDSLPGSKTVNPKEAITNVSITLLPVRITWPPYIQFTAPAYRDDSTGLAAPFGPTIRVKRGETYHIKLTNGLPAHAAANSSQLTQLARNALSKNGTTNWWQHSMVTNLHTHGMHTATGVPSQAFAASGNYTHSDNPFFKLAGGSNASVTVHIRVPHNHLPGLHWAHPHIHGSTALQTGTAHLAIIVEDDNDLWLPAEAGCADVAAVLAAAPDIILDLQLYFFKKPDPRNWSYTPTIVQSFNTLNMTDDALQKVVKVTEDLNNGNYQYMSREANNALCCDDTDGSSTAKAADGRVPDAASSGAARLISGTAAQGRGENFYLINGGYQPTIHLNSNSWARWRFLNSAAKGFTVIKLVDAATNKTAEDCEVMLLAKDGVYLQQIPRAIQGMLLSAANRAEVLARCSGEPGKQYFLWAGDSVPFSSANFNDDEDSAADHIARHLYFKQDVLATIVMTDPSDNAAGAGNGTGEGITTAKLLKGSSSSSSSSVLTKALQDLACTPRRPPYAADLRDANLAANNVASDKWTNLTTGFRAKYLPAPLTHNMYLQWGCGVIKEADLEPGAEKSYHEFSLPDPEPLKFPLGTIVNIDMFNMEFHPVHYHINPFMIAELAEERLCSSATNSSSHVCAFTSYFEPGDYHDTLTLPMMLHSPFYEHPTAIRFQPGEFSGYSLMHCHFLQHEDTGCMSVVHWHCPSQPSDQQEGPCPGFAWTVPADVDEQGKTVVAKLTSSSAQQGVKAQQSGSTVAGWRGVLGWGLVLAALLFVVFV